LPVATSPVAPTPSLLSSLPVAIVVAVESCRAIARRARRRHPRRHPLCRHHHRLRINTVTPHFSLGIPISVWGSPNQNGDPQTEMGMHHKQSPNRFGDPRTKMGIKTSPYQNRNPESVWGLFSH
jgi:hypothetical protein